MKQFKSLMALLLAAILVVGLAVSANAVNISIERDSTYNGSGTGNTYTYYKVFDAVVTSGTSITNADGHTSGTANVLNPQTKGVSYIATKAVKEKLDVTGNAWFDFTPIAGSENFNVSWKSSATVDAATMQSAAKFILDNGAYETGKTGNLAMNNGKWEATVDPGYYVIQGAAGNNLIAATTDISIKEKNAYPPIEKTQADEDNTAQTKDERGVAINDVLDYEVTVTVPATAKVGDEIVVWDKATAGLTYNNDVDTHIPAVKGNLVDAGLTGMNWSKKLTIAQGDIGQTYVFKFSMTVNNSALVDTGRKNEAGLKYGNSGSYKYESKPTEVKYTTYFAGIHKFDGAASGTNLQGVKFELSETNKSGTTTASYVKQSGTYYIPGGSSAEVITDANGMIVIRGLDGDKTYTLTETQPLPGYNPLSGTIQLTLHKDEPSGTQKYDDAGNQDTWKQVANFKGQILPSTGGIGTTIFYVIGAVLVLGAAAIMIARRKAEQE